MLLHASSTKRVKTLSISGIFTQITTKNVETTAPQWNAMNFILPLIRKKGKKQELSSADRCLYQWICNGKTIKIWTQTKSHIFSLLFFRMVMLSTFVIVGKMYCRVNWLMTNWWFRKKKYIFANTEWHFACTTRHMLVQSIECNGFLLFSEVVCFVLSHSIAGCCNKTDQLHLSPFIYQEIT